MTILTLDLHVHTTRSPDAVNPIGSILKRMDRMGLDGVALTDHDRFDPKRIRRLNEQHERTFIPAQEVTTDVGHVLAYFIESAVAPGRDVVEVIEQIHDQGGMAVLAHPFRHRMSYSGELWERIDGIERLNGRSGDPGDPESANARTVRAIEELSIPVTGGSDAHFPWEVGQVSVEVELADGEDIQSAIQSGHTSVRLQTTTGRLTRCLSEVVRRCRGW